MKTLYEKSNWGWSEKNKRSEMMEEAAWYLLAKNEEGKICGFSHFRYDMDFDDEVLYVYEVRTYYSLWLRLNYYTKKLGGIGSNGFHIKLRLGAQSSYIVKYIEGSNAGKMMTIRN